MATRKPGRKARPARWVLALVLLLASALPAGAKRVREERGAEPTELPRIAATTRAMEAHAGVLRFHVDRRAGKVWLEVPPPDARGIAAELLYATALRTGLGSNPVGLDRGLQGPTRWIGLRRIGPRVLVEQYNPAFRARSTDPYERQAVAESFATSVLWGGDIAALDPDGAALVDFTSFLVRDGGSIKAQLADAGQGTFELDPSRSAVALDDCLGFPDNLELEAVLTFAGAAPGGEVRATAPEPTAVTLSLHHSLIRLPDDGYRPRVFDPRAGSYAIGFADFATALDAPLAKRLIVRHRLQRVDPADPRSAARAPIVYYVDRGAPEPVRSALLEGASFWVEAFEAAGFPDGFRVELLPEGAHPLDVRFNVVQWVHRATRGWSYGGGIIDPRTGEMLKGHVRLGSQRVRQDRLLFEGLAGTESTGSGAADDPVVLALARIRQLAAHEVGHALGLAHNFAASTYGRASVMDYPAPLVRLGATGELDFSEAYAVGVGAWDRHAIRYAYAELVPGEDEGAALDGIVREGLDAGLLFLTDPAARPLGASDPRASLWDNGADAVAALVETLGVRAHALARFGERNVAVGTPLAHLQEVLAPLYFHHRYQLDAALKTIGGMEFQYALRGDGQSATRIVPAERQREALDAVLAILDPRVLDLPDSILRLLGPRPSEEGRNREMFASALEPAFDLPSAATTLAAAVIDGLLQPERLGRVLEFHRRDPGLPGPAYVLERLVDRGFTVPKTERAAALMRGVRSALVQRLMLTTADEQLSPELRAWSAWALARALDRLRGGGAREGGEAAHSTFVAAEIERFLERPSREAPLEWLPDAPPPGSPIGSRDVGLASCDGDRGPDGPYRSR